MAESSEGHQVRARYGSSDGAVDAVHALEADGVNEADVRVGDPGDQRHMLERQQQAEMEASVPMIGGGMFTPGQAWGAFKWGAIGVIAGALIVGPVGLLFHMGDWPRWVGVAVLALLGALAFGSMGFVYGGGRGPEVNGEMRSNDQDVTIAVQPRDAQERDLALRALGHTRTQDVDQT